MKLGDNGAGATTAPVTVVAYDGDKVSYPGYGDLVFDISDMIATKARIPLDWGHDSEDSIGYLNRFDFGPNRTGPVTCSGAISLADPDDAVLVQKMGDGVPYQASIESHDFDLEFIDIGQPVTVNARDFVGPIVVVRNVKLCAVAVCKWGKDSDTSTLLASRTVKAKRNKENVTGRKVFRMTEQNVKNMDKESKANAEAVVDAKDQVIVPAETVEAKVDDKNDNAKVEAVVEPAAVEADATVDVLGKIEPAKEQVSQPVPLAAKVETKAVDTDSRAEFKTFVSLFGNELAATYYAEGLSIADAKDRMILSLKKDNDSMKKSLAASRVDRGAANPVTFSDGSLRDNVKAAGSVFKVAGSK